MNAGNVWLAQPIERKISGLNLPEIVEIAFVELIVSRIADRASGKDGIVHVDASFPGDQPGEWYEGYGWAAYTFDDAHCIVTDFDIYFVTKHEE